MLHPSYSDLMSVVNSEVEPGEQPLVQSRYSIVLATAKRARQIIGDPKLYMQSDKKPLSRAVEELYHGEIKILAEDEVLEEEEIAEDASEIVEASEELTEEASEVVSEETTEETTEEISE